MTQTDPHNQDTTAADARADTPTPLPPPDRDAAHVAAALRDLGIPDTIHHAYEPALYRLAGRARTDALTEAYAGAADNPGDITTVATPAQWLRRLFNLPPSQRLAVAAYSAETAAHATACLTENHKARIDALEADLAAEKAEHAAAVREARHVAAERGWDACSDEVGSHDPDLAKLLHDNNPCRTHGPAQDDPREGTPA